jgi:hypothetical protein
MLNVEPERVIWNVVLVKGVIHIPNILLIVVVPTALMGSYCPVLKAKQ